MAYSEMVNDFCHVSVNSCLATVNCYIVAAGNTTPFDTWTVNGCVCGNNRVEPNETCDPPSSCPNSCDDGNACTADQMTGSAAKCNVTCSHTAIVSCASGDGCCPAGCTSANDSDCAEADAG